MVTMKMADKNMINPAKSDAVFPHLHLGSFSAIYQKNPLMYIEHMSGWKSF